MYIDKAKLKSYRHKRKLSSILIPDLVIDKRIIFVNMWHIWKS